MLLLFLASKLDSDFGRISLEESRLRDSIDDSSHDELN